MNGNIILTPRLKKASEMVREGTVVADIGTDHAYLPVYLIKNGLCKFAYACDVGYGPVKSAERTIESCGLQDRVKAIMADGLSGISPENVDDIVICGMGGELIVRILSDADWVRSKKYNFVFQPMSRANELRKYLFESGFFIEREEAVSEGKRTYSIMKVCYTGEKTAFTEADAYIGKLDLSSSDAVKYIQKQLRHLENEEKGLRICGDCDGQQRLSSLINLIKNILTECENDNC